MSSALDLTLADATARGVDTFLSSYVGLRRADGVVVCFAPPCLDAAALVLAAIQARQLPFRAFPFAHRDLDRFDGELGSCIAELRAAPSVARVVVIVCELDSLSFSKSLRRRMQEDGDTLAVVRVTNCLPDLFEMAFQVTPDAQRQINAGALNVLMDAHQLRVRTDRGTDLAIALDPARYAWISSCGIVGPREIKNLPAGEISTYPASINGRLVADGGLNSNLELRFDVRLAQRPMTFDIEDGEVKHFACPDSDLMRFLRWNFDQPFARRVGEFGIGTNIGINRFIALSSHINERHPGVHLGFGEHNQPGLVAYKAEVHLDAITAQAVIETNTGRTLDTQHLAVSSVAHPVGLRAEDAEALAVLATAPIRQR